MATEILRAENCLPGYQNRRKKNVNPKFCRAAADRAEKRFRGKNSKRSGPDSAESGRKIDISMEHVKILRRGQSLDEILKPKEANILHKRALVSSNSCSDLVFWPEMYAGSAFSLSPSPSSVPLPSFSSKNKVIDDFATRDLRRLLRLE